METKVVTIRITTGLTREVFDQIIPAAESDLIPNNVLGWCVILTSGFFSSKREVWIVLHDEQSKNLRVVKSNKKCRPDIKDAASKRGQLYLI